MRICRRVKRTASTSPLRRADRATSSPTGPLPAAAAAAAARAQSAGAAAPLRATRRRHGCPQSPGPSVRRDRRPDATVPARHRGAGVDHGRSVPAGRAVARAPADLPAVLRDQVGGRDLALLSIPSASPGSSSRTWPRPDLSPSTSPAVTRPPAAMPDVTLLERVLSGLRKLWRRCHPLANHKREDRGGGWFRRGQDHVRRRRLGDQPAAYRGRHDVRFAGSTTSPIPATRRRRPSPWTSAGSPWTRT